MALCPSMLEVGTQSSKQKSQEQKSRRDPGITSSALTALKGTKPALGPGLGMEDDDVPQSGQRVSGCLRAQHWGATRESCSMKVVRRISSFFPGGLLGLRSLAS